MADHAQHKPANRLLVVLPTWIGDSVMATPTLRALREIYPKAHITALAREVVKPVIDGCPWIDRVITIRSRRRGMPDARRTGPFNLSRRLALGRFDTAVLLPNSFRTALVVRMAGIPRRIGYERDGRGFLLTDRLLPRRATGKFVPVPTRDYYLGLVKYLGAIAPDPTMALFTRPEHDAAADDLLKTAGFNPAAGRRLIVLNPGANYGDAKIWPAERFGALADLCASRFGVAVAMTGAPRERAILDAVAKSAKSPIIDLPRLGVDLTLLKSVLKRASLVITNDTGPRHIAAALGVPVVTIFGPTDPAWTEIGFALERQVQWKVDCQPCQKKQCPLRGTDDEHICMRRIEPTMVLEHATALLAPDRVPA